MLCPVDISCKLALKPPSLSRHQQGLVLLSPGDMFCSAHAAAISSACATSVQLPRDSHQQRSFVQPPPAPPPALCSRTTPSPPPRLWVGHLLALYWHLPHALCLGHHDHRHVLPALSCGDIAISTQPSSAPSAVVLLQPSSATRQYQ